MEEVVLRADAFSFDEVNNMINDTVRYHRDTAAICCDPESCILANVSEKKL